MSANVIGALLYLRLTSMRNGLRSRLLRLKQPKYLIGGIIGVAYIYFFFIRAVSSPRRPAIAGGADFVSMIEIGGAATVLLFALLSWVLPSVPKGLAFTEAEIATLFPAPVRRRTLIHYRLLSSQFALLFSALIFGMISARWSFTGSFWMRTLAWWAVLATLNLHSTAASFAMARLSNVGITAWPRRALVLTILAACVAGALLLPGRAIDPAGLEFSSFLIALTSEGPLHWLLFVPRVLIAPFFAQDAGVYLFALIPALVVLAAHYAWVIHSETAFEEASVASAEKRAARLAAMRSGKSVSIAGSVAEKAKREPFKLSGSGRAEIAFLWKNLLASNAFFTPRRLLITAVIAFLGARWLTRMPEAPFAGIVFSFSLVLLVMTAFFGPQIARNDLRGDLQNADLLKTYPVPGWQIALGELLAPAFILTCVLWLLLLVATTTLPAERFERVPAESRLAIAVGLGLLAPAWCAIQLIVLNALSLLFPAWMQTLSNRGEQGFDVLGQRILFIAAQLLVVLVAFIPASLVAGVVAFAVNAIAGASAAAIASTIAVLGVLAAEIALGVVMLGKIFERFDLSRELRP